MGSQGKGQGGAPRPKVRSSGMKNSKSYGSRASVKISHQATKSKGGGNKSGGGQRGW